MTTKPKPTRKRTDAAEAIPASELGMPNPITEAFAKAEKLLGEYKDGGGPIPEGLAEALQELMPEAKAVPTAKLQELVQDALRVPTSILKDWTAVAQGSQELRHRVDLQRDIPHNYVAVPAGALLGVMCCLDKILLLLSKAPKAELERLEPMLKVFTALLPELLMAAEQARQHWEQGGNEAYNEVQRQWRSSGPIEDRPFYMQVAMVGKSESERTFPMEIAHFLGDIAEMMADRFELDMSITASSGPVHGESAADLADEPSVVMAEFANAAATTKQFS